MSIATPAFGFLNRFYAPREDADVFRNGLDLLKQAEDAGLSDGWVAQHHFHVETGRLSAPLVFLSHASQAVRKLRLGTAIIVLPLEPVLRLAEDAAVLDTVSAGRFELGLGRGFDEVSFEGFNLDLENRGKLYDHALDRLGKLLSGHEAAPGLTLTPSAPLLASRLWESSRQVENVAQRGNGLIVSPQLPNGPSHVELIARFRRAAIDAQPGHAPRVALIRAVIPGRDRKTVEAEIGEDILRYLKRFIPDASANDLSRHLHALGVVWGHPEEIAAELLEDAALRQVTRFSAQVQTFSTSRAQATERLRLYSEIIVPIVRSSLSQESRP